MVGVRSMSETRTRIRAVVADDEPSARDVVTTLLAEYEQIELVGEMQVDRSLGDAGPLGDIVEPRRGKAACCKFVERGGKDRIAALGAALGARVGTATRRGWRRGLAPGAPGRRSGLGLFCGLGHDEPDWVNNTD